MPQDAATRGSRRTRDRLRRNSRITVRFSDAEKTAIGQAAARSGMAAAAWLATTAVDAASHRALPVRALHRELIAELTRTRAKLGLAAARFDAGGEQAEAAAAECRHAARRLEAALDRVIAGMPR